MDVAGGSEVTLKTESSPQQNRQGQASAIVEGGEFNADAGSRRPGCQGFCIHTEEQGLTGRPLLWSLPGGAVCGFKLPGIANLVMALKNRCLP